MHCTLRFDCTEINRLHARANLSCMPTCDLYKALCAEPPQGPSNRRLPDGQCGRDPEAPPSARVIAKMALNAATESAGGQDSAGVGKLAVAASLPLASLLMRSGADH